MNKLLDFGLRQTCKQKIFLNPDELNADMEKTIENRVRQFEGTCNTQGYILKNSIVLIDRKVGLIPNSEIIGGKAKFFITFQAAILCPKPNHLIPCFVKEKNTIGILAEWGYDDTFPLIITCMKQNQQDTSIFENVHKNQTYIVVKVLSAKCQLKDEKIYMCAEIYDIIDKNAYDHHISEFKSRLLLNRSQN